MPLTADSVAGLRLASRILPPADPALAKELLEAALSGGAVAAGAVLGEWLVGVAIAAPAAAPGPVDDLLAIGVAPSRRGRGVAGSLLRALVALEDQRGRAIVALHTVADRDPFAPLTREVRRSVAERLLDGAGFGRQRVPPAIAAADPYAVLAAHLPPGADQGLAHAVAAERASQ